MAAVLVRLHNTERESATKSVELLRGAFATDLQARCSDNRGDALLL
jgi:hypothetical protein